MRPTDCSAPLPDSLPPLSEAGHEDLWDRRLFLRASAASGLALSGTAAWSQSATSLEGYAQTPSVQAGQTLGFCVRDPGAGTGSTSCSYRVVRLAGWVDLTMQQGVVTVRNHAVPADASSAGCRWPTALSLAVPADWPSGLYYIHFTGSPGSWCSVPFVVRPAPGAAAKRILAVVPVSTAQAKNNYGGGSLYDFGSAGGRRLGRVSFGRPLAERWNYGFDSWQPLLARWLNRRGWQADFCTDLDLHDDPRLLTGRTLMLVAGHHAYWTRAARTAFAQGVAQGLNAALFSGQNMRWQSRLEQGPGGRVLVCYKDAAADPATRPADKTVRWAELASPEPENALIGAGSAGSFTWLRGHDRPSTPFSVRQAHWVFEGTSFAAALAQNVQFGVPPDQYRISFGGELVGPFTDKGPGLSSAALGAPAHATHLASANINSWSGLGAELTPPRDQGSADMMIFSRNGGAGTVFNAGTSDWVKGLEPEIKGLPASDAGVITHNVINRLASGTHVESAVVWERHFDDIDGSMYRHFLGDLAWGYVTAPRPAFKAFAGPVPGAVPVYRYKTAQPSSPDGFRYLLNLNPSLGQGWSRDGIAFFAYPTWQAGARPVYQYHKVQERTQAGGWRLQYSLLPNGSFFGNYVRDGIAFWVPSI
jgi:hypothetical protein